MATYLHRLCLFALLATTGFALSNCQRQAEQEAMVDERVSAASQPEQRFDDPPSDGLGVGGAGMEGMDAGTRGMDAGTMTGTRGMDAGTVMSPREMDPTRMPGGRGLDAGTPVRK